MSNSHNFGPGNRIISHCPPAPFSPSPTPSPCPPSNVGCQCNFKKSRLFCTTDNDDVVLELSTDLQLRTTVATLEVCQEDCSPVLHDICGVIHQIISPVANPTPQTVAFNIQFRIIDNFGREVCQRQVSFAMDITPPDADTTSLPLVLNLPFCIKCCDRPRACDCKVTYRLQADGLNTPGATRFPVIRDVAWSAIVWENC